MSDTPKTSPSPRTSAAPTSEPTTTPPPSRTDGPRSARHPQPSQDATSGPTRRILATRSTTYHVGPRRGQIVADEEYDLNENVATVLVESGSARFTDKKSKAEDKE